MKTVVALIFASSLVLAVTAGDRPTPAIIESLPGLDEMPDFDMYSGYLTGGDQNLFYWLNEAENSDSNKLIVWLQGDAGCSSMYALFKEHGPYTLNDVTGGLEPNQFSWNKFAHTLYLDAPVGTGFSLSGPGHNSTDKATVKYIHQALRYFLYTLHPKYQNFDIYLAGQGTSGLLLTSLAARIMRTRRSTDVLKNRFSGLVLGNPQLDINLNRKSYAPFAFYNGLVGRDVFEVHTRLDCFDAVNLSDAEVGECKSADYMLQEAMFRGDVNTRNYGEKCWKTTSSPIRNQKSNDGPHPMSATSLDEIQQIFLDREMECLHPKPLENYLSQAEVQGAIHAGNIDWKLCSAKVWFSHERQITNVTDKMLKVLGDEGKRVLLYYGDQDVNYNYVGGEMFVNSLNLQRIQPRTPFKLHHQNQNSVVGMMEGFDRLQYAIIFGAGEMAPKDKPEEVSALVDQFINQ